jgi:hypothetical protein
MARELIDSFASSLPESRSARASEAFAYYVLGHACRRLMGAMGAGDRERHGRAAREALGRSVELYQRLADEFDHDPWRGIAETCRGGLFEVDVELGARSAAEVIEELLAGAQREGPGAALAGDRLESCGWWCVFGCNVAMRHLSGKALQQALHSFTTRGAAIAERLGNWALRERLCSLEFARRELAHELVGTPLEWTIHEKEVSVIVGAMGRFPSFRSTGWRILNSATLARGN